jgi:hypothetical protein
MKEVIMGVTGVQSVTPCRVNFQSLKTVTSFRNDRCGSRGSKSTPIDSFVQTSSLQEQLNQTQRALNLACKMLVVSGVKPTLIPVKK